MSTEQIVKFQPDRTLYLRGVDGAGAAAALCQAGPTGFSVCGVFRDMADFCVLVIYDADNTFEHYSVRYLPDFDLSGMVLTFDYTSTGLQPLDSVKYSWIDWGILDLITEAGLPLQVPLFPLATLKSGTFTPASASVNVTAPGGAIIYDRLTLFIDNAGFDFIAAGGETAAQVAANLVYQVNTHNWPVFADSSVSIIATLSGSQITLTNAQTGTVTTSGTTVTWVSGQTFVGLTPGINICLSGFFYTIAEVNSGTQITLTTAPAADAGGGTGVKYTAPRGGIDGNSLTAYVLVRSANISLGVDKTVLPFSGGVSDGLTWTVSIDFSNQQGVYQVDATHHPINSVRQAWLTFAPQLPANSAYTDTEWTVTFANWGTTDANGIGTLQIAGPDSTRIGNADPGCVYSSPGATDVSISATDAWTVLSANNYWRGFSRKSNIENASVTITYSNAQTHDLYLGTSLFTNRGIVNVSVDSDTATTLDCYVNVDSELVTRRQLRSALAPGAHTVVITLTGASNTASSGTNFIFDYLEAAVTTTEIQDSPVTYSNVSPAIDFDTDATYKMSPQRLLWHIRKLGFLGHINEYLGVFWWNQRKRAGAVWPYAVVTVAGTWLENDSAELTIGPPVNGVVTNGFSLYKSVIGTDTIETIANHFVYYINSATVAVWAESTGPGQFTIYARTPNWGEGLQLTANSVAGTITSSASTVGADTPGSNPGYWQVDPSASNPLNFAIQQWHADMFNLVAAAGMLITTSFSMELVYPPDDGTVANAWQARFYDGAAVLTDTGFGGLFSSQCAFIANMTAFQQQVYTAMAALQAAAGLTPWLQFGEFLWWFYSSMGQSIVSLSQTAPLTIGVASPHGMSSGDRVVITGVCGCTSANGTWAIEVVDDTHFSITAIPNGTWMSNTGYVSGGTMAYYDAVTSAAAQAELGRPLYKFTCEDDDPTVNGGADTAFLAGRLKAHIDSITTAVLAKYPNSKFEILYPNDVNNPICLVGPNVPYPQGGRLNAAVNLPPQWLTQEGSGLDSFKVEALSWSATYLDMNLAQQAIVFAVTPPMSWNPNSVAYLVPWFNGTCPWPREFLLAQSRGLNVVNLWAYDHLSLMSWPVPLPVSLERSGFLG
jgi:hypothetical protein